MTSTIRLARWAALASLVGFTLMAAEHAAAQAVNLEALGIPRNCSHIQLHELPPENIAVRGGQPMLDLPAMLLL